MPPKIIRVPLDHAKRFWLGLALIAAITVTTALGGQPAGAAIQLHGTGLYHANTVPAVADEGDPTSVELGTRFTTNRSGYILGVRFYKSTKNTGTHTGSLWTSNGKKLASAQYTEETASGWQTVRFRMPIPVSANTSYVASYHAPRGHYAQQQYAFANGATFGQTPLTARAGLFTYGASAFPTSTWRSSAYYVEPVWSRSRPMTIARIRVRTTSSTTTSPSSTSTSSSSTTSTAPASATSTTSSPTSTSSSTGGFPNESNTGPTGSLATVSGSLTTSASGQVVKDKLITGDLVVGHANVTLQNSRVQGRIRTQSGATNLNVVDSEIGSDTCTSSSDYQLLSSTSVTAVRSHFHGGGADLIRVFGGSVALKDSLVNGGCEYPGDHYDAIQMYGPGAKANLTIDHSTVDGRTNASKGNAAVFWADEPGAGSTLTITNSQLAGGGFTVSLYDANAGSGVFIDVRDNTFVKGSWGYGPCADTNSIAYNGKEGVRFTGNKLSDGTTLSTC